jgi:uncharacterized membrane protein YkoI
MRAIPFVLALLALGLVLAPAPAAGPPNFMAALQVAQELVPGGQLILARPEQKGNTGLIGFYFWVDGKLIEIEIGVGEKVEKIVEKDESKVSQVLRDAIRARRGAKIPLSRFVELALGQIPGGKLSQLELTTDQDRLRVHLDVKTGEDTLRVNIDPATGRVVKIVKAEGK